MSKRPKTTSLKNSRVRQLSKTPEGNKSQKRPRATAVKTPDADARAPLCQVDKPLEGDAEGQLPDEDALLQVPWAVGTCHY